MGLVILSRPISPNQESSRLLKKSNRWRCLRAGRWNSRGFRVSTGTQVLDSPIPSSPAKLRRKLSSSAFDCLVSAQFTLQLRSGSQSRSLYLSLQLNLVFSVGQYRISITRIDLRLLRLKLGDEFWNTMIRISSSVTNHSFVRVEESVIESS